MASEIEKAVWHFTRNQFEDKHDCNVPLSLKYLILQFSKKVISMLTIKENLDFYELLSSKLGTNLKRKEFKLLYTASAHGFTPSEFHKSCDGHASTITLIKNKSGNIFGGFTNIAWSTPSNAEYKSDANAFLFLIRSCDESKECPKAYELKGGPSCAVFHQRNFGPGFGCGNIVIRDDRCFDLQVGLSYSYADSSELYGDGSGNSNIVEYQVYEIN